MLLFNLCEVFFSNLWMNIFYRLTHFVWFTQASVLNLILFTIYVSPIASLVSSHNVHQQQYADDTQLFLFLFLSSMFDTPQSRTLSFFSPQLVSLQRSGSKH